MGELLDSVMQFLQSGTRRHDVSAGDVQSTQPREKVCLCPRTVLHIETDSPVPTKNLFVLGGGGKDSR